MVAANTIGNKSEEESDDIDVVAESDPKTITYSLSSQCVITRRCRNKCPYCAFNRRDSLCVPYSTIREAKAIREAGAREIIYVAGERPDKYSDIRATLDLWGFNSYIEYLYTIAELGFLEGLIPVIEVGFLSPLEMKKMHEICGLFKIMLDSVDAKHFEKIYGHSPGKQIEVRLKNLEWSGRLGFPTVTGIMVGIGETQYHRKAALREIAAVHNEFGTIHELSIQNFIPQIGTPFKDHSATDHKTILSTVEMARELMPDVMVTIPPHHNTNWNDFIKAGVRDFGSIPIDKNPTVPFHPAFDFEEFKGTVEKAGYKLHQRLPLSYSFIKNGKYSKKLGQVFDNYKYKIKKMEQERLRDDKMEAIDA
ncbi:MAG: 7,8-didemethyl-8-hydroxy-5-deazariboflavin synthase subunit CofG [bacterium]|nr:7,8-didemethyl-8-hydroxy-5-deazariboflavin synthase subunit CofG [bacterium]